MSTATLPAPRPALTAKGAATRLRIVEAAAQLVRQHGAARTSIDEVRAEAQVSASQLYHYFGDKKELMRAVVAHEAALMIDEQQPQLERIESIESLRAWRDATVEHARRRGFRGWSPLGSLASELIDTDPDARAGLIDGFGLWLSPVQAGLLAMRESGALRPDADPDALAAGLLAALQGGLLVSRVLEQTAPLETALDASIAHIQGFASVAPAVRRMPASPARASATPNTTGAPGPAAARVPLRPRRPATR